eukprot:CAMPEP_0172547932 /NCGR_PEP_ID=MMETSP1067-20121228/17363_1 /TAXON_ID=265564 ORGANISM="Thalassiosira punctigera, Strain Tpunct2005C2" /NCGR_SAMPLE_ID=MMETSP1067 /ASSEMBLY_ACC=CAM_ASM_000444 /LENGTH=58 /DNA_ID=CAMNT_0013335093 /DNA_START=38 /DNA_END=211 /DNA_ORIENTATION=+
MPDFIEPEGRIALLLLKQLGIGDGAASKRTPVRIRGSGGERSANDISSDGGRQRCRLV